MATIDTAPAPVLPQTSDDDDTIHTVCGCTPDITLCGFDVSDAEDLGPDAEPSCIVCDDLHHQPCPRCGE